MKITNRILKKMDDMVFVLLKYVAILIFCLLIAIPSCRNRQEPAEQEINDFEIPFAPEKSKFDSVLQSHTLIASATTDIFVNENEDSHE